MLCVTIKVLTVLQVQRLLLTRRMRESFTEQHLICVITLSDQWDFDIMRCSKKNFREVINVTKTRDGESVELESKSGLFCLATVD